MTDDRRQEQQQGGWSYGAGRFAEKSSDFIRWLDWGALLDADRGPLGKPWWKWILGFLILLNVVIPVAIGLVRARWLP